MSCLLNRGNKKYKSFSRSTCANWTLSLIRALLNVLSRNSWQLIINRATGQRLRVADVPKRWRRPSLFFLFSAGPEKQEKHDTSEAVVCPKGRKFSATVPRQTCDPLSLQLFSAVLAPSLFFNEIVTKNLEPFFSLTNPQTPSLDSQLLTRDKEPRDVNYTLFCCLPIVCRPVLVINFTLFRGMIKLAWFDLAMVYKSPDLAMIVLWNLILFAAAK